MQIWLNSLDIKTLTLADQLGLLYGVTTNPSLIAKSELNLEENIEAILKCHDKPIAIQVTAVDHAGIIEQAEVLSDLSERIIVKVPVTQEGLKAMHSLAHLRFQLMATAIFTPLQALFACRAGAAYIAPFYSRLKNPLETTKEIMRMLDHYRFETTLLVASLKNEESLLDCFHLGAHAACLEDALFHTLIRDQSGTFEALDRFSKDWKKAKPSSLFS